MIVLNDEAVAAARFERWRSDDPFPQIPPTLLNSADIIDYVNQTGMICPFREQNDDGEEKLKSASYEVDFLGSTTYWDEQGQKVSRRVGRGEGFVFRRNSIAFVQVEPYFRIPEYIALRFNLKIQHVYRGILLGTGPLVDPGFEGPLYIPLHNLTDGDYEFHGGEGLIWMEFTKLSWPPPARVRQAQPVPQPAAPRPEARNGRFYSFPTRKLRRRTLDDYLWYASPHRPIRSSIPVEIAKSSEAATRATRAVNVVSAASIIAALGVGAAIVALVFQAISYINDTRSEIRQRLRDVEQRVRTLSIQTTRPATTVPGDAQAPMQPGSSKSERPGAAR
jgi:deoxycytidine triphosphate deaminase